MGGIWEGTIKEGAWGGTTNAKGPFDKPYGNLP